MSEVPVLVPAGTEVEEGVEETPPTSSMGQYCVALTDSWVTPNRLACLSWQRRNTMTMQTADKILAETTKALAVWVGQSL